MLIGQAGGVGGKARQKAKMIPKKTKKILGMRKLILPTPAQTTEAAGCNLPH